MTLIAFTTGPNQAEIITDTWTYEGTGRTLGHGSKVHPIPHLDMVVMSQGDARFGHLAKFAMTVLLSATFDELVTHARPTLLSAWDACFEEVKADNADHATAFALPPSAVFLVGYSHERARFRAVGYSTHNAFIPFDIEGLHVMPAPFTVRPSDVELARFRAEVNKAPRSNDAANLAHLESLPRTLPAPETAEEWVALAMQARQDRSVSVAVNTRLKVFVGGDLHLTRLERGLVSTTRLLSFNDRGEELAAIMAGTLHPFGQAGPCTCGSGARYVDCCLAEIAGEPCLCGSTRPLAECCMLSPAEAPVPA